MAGMGPPPKTDGTRRRRNAATFDWDELPADGRSGEAPELPEWRNWLDATREWWAMLWKTPQATKWDQSGVTLFELAVLHHELMTQESKPHTVISTMITIADRHGLSPKALMNNRWTIAPAVVGAPVLASVTELKANAAPAKRAKKPEWVDHAVRCGMHRDEANATSKPELIKRYGTAVGKPKTGPAAVSRLR